MIEIKDLNKSFGDTVVLKNLNLTIDSGSIFGLVGINGAGKSTLLRCLAGIYQADSGTIQIDGQDVYENEIIKKQIVIVPDDPYFSRNSTINSLKTFYQ
ncbi:MAG: ATP-binding cassette domain-containing protein, partial [Erysipelotrichaceae bacterium]|nr:ATP-binding cassette domain-containing protein [Erysipelotrichaceae bacterium]